jgi:trimeric autotransporter adhesin
LPSQLCRTKVVEKALEIVSGSNATGAAATLHSFASIVSALTAAPAWARSLIEDLCYTVSSDDSTAFTAAAHAAVMRIIEGGTVVSVVEAVAEHLHAAVVSVSAAAAASTGNAAWSIETLYADAVAALIAALTAAASAGRDTEARSAFTALKTVYSAVCEHSSSGLTDGSAVLEAVQQLLTAFCSTDCSSGSTTDRLLGYRADVLELLWSADTTTTATAAGGHSRGGSAAALAAVAASATGAAATAHIAGPSLAALRTAELVTRHFDSDAVAALRGSDQSWESRSVLLDALFPQVSTAAL